MQHHPHEPSDSGSDNLLPSSDDRRTVALTIARAHPQPLSLDLRMPGAAEREDEVNLFDYWRILVKRRWTVLAVLAMVLVIGLVKTLLTTPIYRAGAVLQIENDTMQVVQVEGINQGTGMSDYGASFLQTQLQLLKSRALAQRVVSQLGIADSGDMARLQPPSPWQRLRSLIGGKSDESADEAAPAKKPAKGKAVSDNAAAQLAAWFQSGVSVEQIQESRLVKVQYDSPSPEFSQRAANAMAEAFIASNLERRFDSASYAKNYLEDRLQELKLKLEDSEKKLVEFAQKEQIVSTGEESGASLSQLNLGSLNTAYAKAKEERIRAQSRWQQAQGLRGTGLQNNAGENPMIKTLQETRAKLLLEYQDKLRLYKPDYPVMQQLKGQIDEINKQVAAEEGNIRAGIQAEYLAAASQEKMLADQMTGSKNEVLDLESRSIQYNIFKRDVDTNRQLYDGLLQRYKQIGVAGGVTSNNIAIIDRAEPGGKIKPDVTSDLAKAGLIGLMLGVLLALGFEYLDDTIKRPEDMEKLLGLPVLGAIPLLKAPQTPEKALQDLRSAFSEAYRSLRTALQFSTELGVPRSLLITSAMPSEGKSTTALVLAQYFAQLGKRVLIIDCDLRNPTLHRALKVDNSVGLSNFLAGAGKAMEMIQPTSIPDLMYMPTGPLPPNPAELLMCSKMMSLLTVAAEKFDMVILDGPPVMGLADAPILSNIAHGTLLVVHAGETRVAVVRNALKRLQAARARMVGGLLTHFQSQHAGEGYGYGGYNYYAYGGTPQLTKR